MKNKQFAVLHFQACGQASGALTQHIERRNAKGSVYVPDNADRSRTHLNRELLKFPEGVKNRSEAIMNRIKKSGITRKIGKNQNVCINILLTGSPERMHELQGEKMLNEWANANYRWLCRTFGKENVVSMVIHLDETTPHIHATVVPISTAPRERREREGEKRYKKQSGPRLCASELMTRDKLRNYQSTYANAMAPFGLERGAVGSEARHVPTVEYYNRLYNEKNSQIAEKNKKLEELDLKIEKAEEGRSRVWEWLGGKGVLHQTREELAKEKGEKAKLEQDVARLKAGVENQKNKSAQEKFNLTQTISKNIAERDRALEERDTIRARYEKLNREVHPEKYRLTSGAELVDLDVFMIKDSHVSFITSVQGELYDDFKCESGRLPILEAYERGEVTKYEVVNELFEPFEQINQAQYNLLCAAATAACGGPAQAHVGIGGGGSTSDLPWGEDRRHRRSR